MSHFDAIILAAGLGTRMNSDIPKVLHEIDGKPIIYHVLNSLNLVRPRNIILVVGHGAKDVIEKVNSYGFKNVQFALQTNQLGTAHAVREGLSLYSIISETPNFVLVMYGDVPLIRSYTLRTLINVHMKKKPEITMLTTEVPEPHGYGRIIRDSKNYVVNIVEEKDASLEQKSIKEINPGFFCIEYSFLIENIKKISNENNKGEYYLTDLINIAKKQRCRIIGFNVENYEELMGINTIDELWGAVNIYKQRY
jgi:bifunctional UDP-N-acetylglucosamine pyrophosphorylase / glucosamine-1-phosphate N-acetyltransferase